MECAFEIASRIDDLRFIVSVGKRGMLQRSSDFDGSHFNEHIVANSPTDNGLILGSRLLGSNESLRRSTFISAGT
ncbi:hypothetical protein HDF11_000683 [Tunturiibacter psychrotolerans]